MADNSFDTPEAFREHILSRVLRDETATPGTLALLDDALRLFPASAALWCLRGDLVQLCDDDTRLEEVVESYLKAAELDPRNPEPLESLGHFYDGVLDDPAAAEPYFRQAIALGAGESARDGLAEVLEQLASTDER